MRVLQHEPLQESKIEETIGWTVERVRSVSQLANDC